MGISPLPSSLDIIPLWGMFPCEETKALGRRESG